MRHYEYVSGVQILLRSTGIHSFIHCALIPIKFVFLFDVYLGRESSWAHSLTSYVQLDHKLKREKKEERKQEEDQERTRRNMG